MLLLSDFSVSSFRLRPAQLCSVCVFQVSIYIMQMIFAAVDIPAKFVALVALTFLGRRYSQAGCLFMSAVVIFGNIFIPAGDLCTKVHKIKSQVQ